MLSSSPINPIDYLVIGHLSEDITPAGSILGGTVAYSALTARAMGLRVGIVTQCSPKTDLGELDGITIVNFPGDTTTTFEIITSPTDRTLYLHKLASPIEAAFIPESWKQTPIVHLGPVAQEIDPSFVRLFPNSMVGLTIQGWLRDWDIEGRIQLTEWPEARVVLEKANAAVLSIDDVNGDEFRIEEMMSSIRVLAVTEGADGVRLYWNGDLRRFRAPAMEAVDTTGAGDIFAAAFFIRLQYTQNPWEAARFATQMAAASVTRVGLQSIPSLDELQQIQFEVFEN
jgi:sugar/nucleoside kinase (ribokinase family)